MSCQMREKRKRKPGMTIIGSPSGQYYCSPRQPDPKRAHAPDTGPVSRRETQVDSPLSLSSKRSSIKQMNSTYQDTSSKSNGTNTRCRRRNAFVFPPCHRALLATLVAAGFLLLLLIWLPHPARTFFIDERQSPAMSEWNYADQTRWKQMHRECAGRAQSPIDIQHRNVIVSQHLRLHFYNYNQQIKFKLSNAHHTVKMNPVGAPYDHEGDDQHRHGGGAGRSPGGAFNSSSIHDMITADEYVEFPAANMNQQQQQQQHEGPADAANSLLASSSQPGQSQADKERLVSLPVGSADNRLHQQRVNLNNRPQMSSSKQNSNADKGRHYNNNNNDNNNNNNDTMLANHPNYVENDSGDGQQGQAAADSTGLPYEGAPTIKLDWLDDGNNEYKLRDIHFHWGERRDNGSEHAIDGRRAAMEMHLVHIKQGLDKSKIGFTSDSVAVIAILIESHRKSNADFNPIVNELARINSTEQAQLIDYKSIYDLLPSNLDSFYTYSGSLTTPPCYQVVNWIVMAERLNMNAKQIEMFRSLYAPPSDHESDERPEGTARADAPPPPPPGPGHFQYKWRRQQGNKLDPYNTKNQSFQTLSDPSGGSGGSGGAGAEGDDAAAEAHVKWLEMIMPNVRSIQELNNRTILASFTKYGSRLKAAINRSHSLHNGYSELNTLLLVNLLAALVSARLALSCATRLS